MLCSRNWFRDGRGGESAAGEEGIDGGGGATETLVERHGMLGAATGEDVAAEGVGCGRVENAVGFEEGKGVGIKHFCPFVTVVAGCIASAEDVPEGCGGAGAGNKREEFEGGCGACFELGDGTGKGGGE